MFWVTYMVGTNRNIMQIDTYAVASIRVCVCVYIISNNIATVLFHRCQMTVIVITGCYGVLLHGEKGRRMGIYGRSEQGVSNKLLDRCLEMSSHELEKKRKTK